MYPKNILNRQKDAEFDGESNDIIFIKFQIYFEKVLA